MEIRNAVPEDFDLAFDYIEKLWDYNDYDKETVRGVYREVLDSDDAFFFFLFDEGKPRGLCHGVYFNTFWLSGMTCYLSSIITNAEDRKKGYGTMLMDHAVKLAKERKCKAIVLDSANFRTWAHKFYEDYGFEGGSLCFDLMLD
jgi:GNAT superfamily N-acetyltransferase